MSFSTKNRIKIWLEKQLFYPGDSADTLALKMRFFLFVVQGLPGLCLIGLFFWIFGLPTVAFGIWLFAGIEFIIGSLFMFMHRFVSYFILVNQYFFVLTSFAGVIYFGGILNSGGMVLIGLAGALQSLSFFKPNQIRYIFTFYLLTVLTEAVLQPYLKPIPEITPTGNLILFVLHLFVIAFALFNVLSMYINQSIEIKKLETQRLQELDTIKTNFYPTLRMNSELP